MVKRVMQTYRGMNQDVTKSKHPFEFYYAANNIRIVNIDNQDTYSVSNEKGNSLEITIPSLSINTTTNLITYGENTLAYSQGSSIPEIEQQINEGTLPSSSSDQEIIGYSVSRDGIILFTTDSEGFDCIWEVEEFLDGTYDLTLLYVRDLGFSRNYPIQTLFNYENERIQKVYWVDGYNQLRFVNIRQTTANNFDSNLIDLSSTTLNMVGNFILSQPLVTGFGAGGEHTSGMIQYAYNLYRLNSSQTKISPLSEIVALDKGTGNGGGAVNEVVGSIPIVQINDIDQNYTHIKVYAVKYTSLNQEPTIGVIREQEIPGESMTIFDDGEIIETLSTTEFAFLGSDPIVPKNIDSKDNVLFPSNIKELNFDLNIDMRAYSHDSGTNGVVWDNVRPSAGNPNVWIGEAINFTAGNYTGIPQNWDAVNPDYDTYKYQSDGTTLGGEGTYIKYALLQESFTDTEAEDYRFFKDNEIYRIGIEFYNALGQTSFPKWIADFRAPEGNLEGNYNILRVDLKPAFYTWFAAQDTETIQTPIGYRILRANRNLQDRSIICQGSVVPMMARTTDSPEDYSYWNILANRQDKSRELVKFPITLSRGFNDDYDPVFGTSHLRKMNNSGGGNEDTPTEIWEATNTDFKRAQSWQYSKLFQMYTPEATFNTGLSFGEGLKLRIKGMSKHTNTAVWWKKIDTTNESELLEIKDDDVTDFYAIDGDSAGEIYKRGIFGPSVGDTEAEFFHIYREYGTYENNSNTTVRDVYGKPEITSTGQSSKAYNNNDTLKYSNSMAQFITDKGPANNDEDNESIVTMNSWGTNCITLAEGTVDEVDNKLSLEQIRALTSHSADNGLLHCEITIPEPNIYLGSLYGGNSYEAKSRTSYLKIGQYRKLSSGTVIINSPGDTYVQDFLLQRVVKTDTINLDDQVIQHAEFIKFKVETTIDLKNRNDISFRGWDTQFQPSENEFHDYNRVYSQQPTLIQNAARSFTFREVDNYDARIHATKTKIPGEDIDSWTDLLVNEYMDLDGKYGPINATVNMNDNIYAIQDEAVAFINISPNVQVQADDGTTIELGTGNLLYSYQYLTTKSGSINKWSVTPGVTAFYYYDALNQSLMKVQNNQIINLSDTKGFNAFFKNNIPYSTVDNPVTNSAIVCGYNSHNSELYLTKVGFFTICYNEFTDSFTSFYSFTPSFYIMKGSKMVTTDPNLTELWEHFKGSYGSYYGTIYDSDITLLVNPPEHDCVFNNITYKSEVINQATDPAADVPKATLTQIKAYNEYQDSGTKDLVLNSNLNRKFRMWRATIPRDAGTIDRIRGHWMYLELTFDNGNNYKLVLHDIMISYNAY